MSLSFRFKVRPEDFLVEELPGESFGGQGHYVLKIEKVGVSTLDVVSQISRVLGLGQKDVGYLGLKDAQAVAVQYMSVPRRRYSVEELRRLSGDGFRVLEVLSHSRKLRAGHLKGNRFRITLRDVNSPALLEEGLLRLRREGFPNFYDTQRFGTGGANLERGMRLLRGERLRASPYQKRLYVSAVSAWFFNLYLTERMARGMYPGPVEGDLVLEGEYWVPLRFAEDPEGSVPTGPVLGYRMPLPDGKALELERELMEREGIDLDAFRPLGAKGSRRPIRVWPENLRWELSSDTAVLEFTLPAGSYATVMLGWIREFHRDPV